MTAHRDPEDWARTFLDTEYALAPDDVPPDLVPVTDAGVPGRGRVRALVIEDLDALYRAAVKAGKTFRVVSAYRSYDQQVATFASLDQAYGQDYAVASAARPGHSEHQLGTTIDVEGGEQWLARNAWRYGFVMSYPPDRSPEWTCYKPEPWHFRYFGRSVAKAIHESDVSAREWLWELQDEGPRP